MSHSSLKIRLTAVLAALLLFIGSAHAQSAEPTLPPFEESVPEYNPANPSALTPDQIYAQAFVLMNENDGQILMEKNADVRVNPASTTKIMTLLLAVEYGQMYEVVKIPEAAAEIPNDSSVVPVEVGEEMTLLDLLYGMMLRSGNDAANAVAVLIGGSVDNFVNMMNARAEELGCTGTHFSNPHGYTADDHYTTVRDMALITQAAMQYSVARKIVGTGVYTMNRTNYRDEYRIQNSNLLVVYGGVYHYSGATGVKTGTTSAAGQCLVSSAERSGVELICVAFKSTINFADAKWQDATRLLDYGFSKYRTYTFDDLYNMVGVTVPISGVAADDASRGVIKLNALVNRSGSYEKLIHEDNLDELLEDFKEHLTIEYTHEMTAPIEVGTIMGRLTFTPDDGDVITAVLVADRSVAAAPSVAVDRIGDFFNTIPRWVYVALLFLVFFLIILIIARIIIRIRRARRRAQAKKRARERAKQQAAQRKAERRRYRR